MALDSARVAEDLGADVTLLLARRKMDQLTVHARYYVFPRWISLLRMSDIMFCHNGSVTAHARHYVFQDGSAYGACATLCFATMDQSLRMRDIMFSKMDQLTAHARHYVLPRWISLLRMGDIMFCH